MIGKKIATALSILFHPVWMPTASAYLLFYLTAYTSFRIDERLIWLVTSVLFLCTCLIPVFMTFWLWKTKVISDLEISERTERRLPYLLTSISYASAFYMISKLQLPSVIFLSVLAATASVIFTMVINLFWKISAHLVGMGGLTGALIGFSLRYYIDVSPWIYAAILVSGLVGWSRLVLGIHSPKQVYAGFLLGLLFQLLLLSGL